MSRKKSLVDPDHADRIVEALQQQAAQTSDPHIKRLLLAAGCDILDYVLEQQTGKAAA